MSLRLQVTLAMYMLESPMRLLESPMRLAEMWRDLAHMTSLQCVCPEVLPLRQQQQLQVSRRPRGMASSGRVRVVVSGESQEAARRCFRLEDHEAIRGYGRMAASCQAQSRCTLLLVRT
jgi:hypothetical protein